MNVLSVLVDQIRNASAPALLFSGGAVLLWLWIFVWGFRTQTHWYRRALVIATLYCFISEYLSIRLGKYHYALLPLSLPDFEMRVPDPQFPLARGSPRDSGDRRARLFRRTSPWKWP